MNTADWRDPSSAWWAKHGHAVSHQARLAALEDSYKAAKPYRFDAESTDDPNVIQYRFRSSAAVPRDISLVLGNLVHNLRSALDSLTLALVSNARGRTLTESEEQACQFPICQTPDEFTRFMRSRNRAQLYGDAVVSALREGQPFHWLEYAKERGIQSAEPLTYEEDSRFHHLTTLSRLSNIDKHRRLTVTAWWPSLLWWTREEGDESEQSYAWAAQPPWQDGDVVGRMTVTGNPPNQVIHEVVLVALDDPAHTKHDTASHGLSRNMRTVCDGVAMTISSVVAAYVRAQDCSTSTPDTTQGCVTN